MSTDFTLDGTIVGTVSSAAGDCQITRPFFGRRRASPTCALRITTAAGSIDPAAVFLHVRSLVPYGAAQTTAC